MPKKKRDLTYNGHKYDSQLEIRIYKRLSLLKSANKVKDFTPHKQKYTFTVNKQRLCSYLPDFEITTMKNETVVIDCKGYVPTAKKKAAPKGWAVFKLKQKLMKIMFNINVEVICNEIELMKLLKI